MTVLVMALGRLSTCVGVSVLIAVVHWTAVFILWMEVLSGHEVIVGTVALQTLLATVCIPALLDYIRISVTDETCAVGRDVVMLAVWFIPVVAAVVTSDAAVQCCCLAITTAFAESLNHARGMMVVPSPGRALSHFVVRVTGGRN